MGYNFTIGNASVYYNQEDEYCKIEAESARSDNAPSFGEPTDCTNERWPSYSGWHNFCRVTNLHDLFFNEENGILRDHPGCVPLSIRHKKEIDKSYKLFRSKYPNVVAEYSSKILNDIPDENWPEENGALCRLEWLKYWVDWALENCEKPVFENSLQRAMKEVQ